MKGFHVSVYRWDGPDCTNDGVSKGVKDLTIVDHPSLDALFEATDEAPPVKCITRTVMGRSFPIIVPLDAGENGFPYMFGGNFAYTSDSRFSQNVSTQPVKIFDRREF